MDILPGALEAGHRVLLFSQFTSMLSIIKQRLTEAGIKWLYLDGQTPAEERIALVKQFNAGAEAGEDAADVFLISLKAGGSGLNLTGADMVIHYDPWWNPAVEDQATDRVHRSRSDALGAGAPAHHQGHRRTGRARDVAAQARALFDQVITLGRHDTHPAHRTGDIGAVPAVSRRTGDARACSKYPADAISRSRDISCRGRFRRAAGRIAAGLPLSAGPVSLG